MMNSCAAGSKSDANATLPAGCSAGQKFRDGKIEKSSCRTQGSGRVLRGQARGAKVMCVLHAGQVEAGAPPAAQKVTPAFLPRQHRAGTGGANVTGDMRESGPWARSACRAGTGRQGRGPRHRKGAYLRNAAAAIRRKSPTSNYRPIHTAHVRGPTGHLRATARSRVS